jgi:hypothetical protein
MDSEIKQMCQHKITTVMLSPGQELVTSGHFLNSKKTEALMRTRIGERRAADRQLGLREVAGVVEHLDGLRIGDAAGGDDEVAARSARFQGAGIADRIAADFGLHR